ncbi:MAG: aminotransferase class V-fold PLP-dependent enzyme [Pirellulales bacterium]|nr:aminotransferase class V-fold PLP-dependent enzyme [Pirellulales bacterium]
MSSAKTEIEITRQTLRDAMPITKKWAYFDHAAVAPLSAPASAALRQWLVEATDDGTTQWPRWAKRLAAMRAVAARMIGAHADEIALVPSTTAGINLVAEGLDWQLGDNVVTLDEEFPSNLYPWMHLERLGVETRRVPTNRGRVDLEQFAQHCDERTRVVSISWVGYANGCRRDVRAFADIAHQYGAFLFLDAIQGLGVFPLDVAEAGVDCLSADGHKWMLGPEGAGIAYVRRDCLPRLRPTGVGWNSVVHAADFSHIELKFKPTAARYEGGSQNMAGFLALGASIDLLCSLGVRSMATAILDITEQATKHLAELGAVCYSPRENIEECSGIVSFELPGRDPVKVRKHCLSQGVVLACRAGRLRISAHAYNNSEDLERLVAALKSV